MANKRRKSMVPSHEVWHVAVGSLGSSFVSVVIPYPFDVVRTRQQCGVNQQRQISSVMREVFQTGGIRGIYKGMSGVLTFDLFGTFAYFQTFHSVKQWLNHSHIVSDVLSMSLPIPMLIHPSQNRSLSMTAPFSRILRDSAQTTSASSSHFYYHERNPPASWLCEYSECIEDGLAGLASVMAGLLFWVPMDCIVGKSQVSNSVCRSTSPFRIAQQIWLKEGLLCGFYKGYCQSLMTIGPMCSIFWCLYEYLKRRRRINEHGFISVSDIDSDSHSSHASRIDGVHLAMDASLAGVTAIFSTQWIDTLRARTQVSGAGGLSCYSGEGCNLTVTSQLRRLYKTEGLSRMLKTLFLSGFRARLLSTGPDLVLGVLSFETLLYSFSGHYISH